MGGVIHIDAPTNCLADPSLKTRGLRDRGSEGECAEDFIVEGNTDGDNQLPGPSGQDGQRCGTLLAEDTGSEMTATTFEWQMLANRIL